ncbi:putative membrane protein [Crossiella cryophila]|uniref:Putative membrane protein n=1 Tax=Crossiella cryophila TaxID=43355 RepID=A0A7W7FRR3_9PSEU|nr:putative membrane protein [Crossiella cryophila]
MEIFFTGLLVAACLVITWFAVYVVYRLYSDQR